MFVSISKAIAMAAIIAAAVVLAPRAANAGPVVVFAAASLKTALDDVAAKWTSVTGNKIAISYAGSPVLARQIQQGAPADIYVSANVDWMDTLARDGLIRPGTRRDLLGNRLVLIAHGKDMTPLKITPGFDLAGLLGDRRLAMALVDAVPAGIYGKAALTSLGIWKSVQSRVAQAENVRAALALVARGEAPFGIVYATDATAEDNVSVVATFTEDTHPPIIYPAALTTEADTPRARAFLDFLSSDMARPLFARQGFIVFAIPE